MELQPFGSQKDQQVAKSLQGKQYLYHQTEREKARGGRIGQVSPGKHVAPSQQNGTPIGNDTRDEKEGSLNPRLTDHSTHASVGGFIRGLLLRTVVVGGGTGGGTTPHMIPCLHDSLLGSKFPVQGKDGSHFERGKHVHFHEAGEPYKGGMSIVSVLTGIRTPTAKGSRGGPTIGKNILQSVHLMGNSKGDKEGWKSNGGHVKEGFNLASNILIIPLGGDYIVVGWYGTKRL